MSNIKPLHIDDIEHIMPIEQACHSHPWSSQTMASCFGSRYFSYGLWQQQTLIGFYFADFVAGESTLMDICVNPEHQGKGFGKRLMQHFEQQAKSLGAQQLFLEVRASNIAAQLLYINQQFIEISRRTGYYPCEIGYEDAIVMSKSL